MAVALGVALVVCGALAHRYPIAPAILLVLVGVLIGFVPHLRQAQLPPEVVLLLFLPVLLYWESLTTSLREIRNNLRVVVLTSTVLVLATAAAVATAAHAIGLQWGPAWVLGAALAPTDATAVGVLARRLPRRTVTVLRAESLVNDGTALVIYGLAVGVTVGEEQLTPLHVGGLLVVAYGGGLLTGALIGLLSWQLRRRMDDSMLENIAMLVTPFAAFLLAESIHASGVLAVVVCGLFMSQVTPRITGALTRQTSVPFWTVSTTVLSSALFVLVGLQAQTAVRDLSSVSLVRALVDVLLVTAVVVGVRWAWLYTTPYIIRALDRRPAQRLRLGMSAGGLAVTPWGRAVRAVLLRGRSGRSASRLRAMRASQRLVYWSSCRITGSPSAPSATSTFRRFWISARTRSTTRSSVPSSAAVVAIASIAASVMNSWAYWRSSVTELSTGNRAKRTTRGSSSACSSVRTITPQVMTTMRSRSGKGAPESRVRGTASTAASETAPRNPATPLTVRWRAPSRRSRCAGRRSSARMM
jgi:NhaP-type Na+/H+ or K+/H+ antiporter